MNHLNWKRTVQEFLADKAETPVPRLWDTKVGQLGEFLCGVSSYFISPAGGGPTRLAIALRVQRGFLFLIDFILVVIAVALFVIILYARTLICRTRRKQPWISHGLCYVDDHFTACNGRYGTRYGDLAYVRSQAQPAVDAAALARASGLVAGPK